MKWAQKKEAPVLSRPSQGSWAPVLQQLGSNYRINVHFTHRTLGIGCRVRDRWRWRRQLTGKQGRGQRHVVGSNIQKCNTGIVCCKATIVATLVRSSSMALGYLQPSIVDREGHSNWVKPSKFLKTYIGGLILLTRFLTLPHSWSIDRSCSLLIQTLSKRIWFLHPHDAHLPSSRARSRPLPRATRS
jgi:hypothetical protein